MGRACEPSCVCIRLRFIITGWIYFIVSCMWGTKIFLFDNKKKTIVDTAFVPQNNRTESSSVVCSCWYRLVGNANRNYYDYITLNRDV